MMMKSSWGSPLFPAVLALALAACGGGGGSSRTTEDGGEPPPAPTVTVTLNDADITTLESATLEWTSTGATSCTAAGSWSGTKAGSGSQVITSDSPGTLTFHLTCTGEGGSSSDSVSLTVTAAPGAPSVTLTATPAILPQGGSTTLEWSSENATACTASGDWSGDRATSGTAAVTPASSGTMVYRLSCTGPFGTSIQSTSVFVNPAPAPTLTLTLSPSTINAGEPVAIAWTTTSATTCIASGASTWEGGVPTSGNTFITVTAAGNYTLGLICAGPGGSVAKTAALTANPPLPPTVTISLSPPSIIVGQTSTLVWSSTSTSSCTGSGPASWAGDRTLQGGVQVTSSQAGTYTYTLTCTGLGGTASASTTLTAVASSIVKDFTVSLVAGGIGGAGALDGGLAEARLSTPRQALMDNVGNLYILDQTGHAVRRLSTDGKVNTFAGEAYLPGTTDGTGAAARFRLPEGMAIDAANNLYVGDTGNHCIRKISPAAVVTTLAGLCGTAGMNNGSGSAARFDRPSGLVVDSNGNIYVMDRGNFVIRKITAAGEVTTYAGQPGVSGTANGAPGTATLDVPGSGIARAPDGTLYFTDHHAIRAVDPAGNISTRAGSITEGESVDSNLPLDGRFRSPQGLLLDAGGNIYVADTGNSQVRGVASSGQVITFTGQETTFGFANSGTSPALFNEPTGMLLVSGSLLVVDSRNHAIRIVAGAGSVTTLAGGPKRTGSSEGTGAAAQFDRPDGIVAMADGALYVVDAGNAVIRKIVGQLTSTFAGSKGAAGTTDGAPGTGQLFLPTDLARMPDGTLVVADGSAIRTIAADGTVTTLAGVVNPPSDSYLDAVGTNARFIRPQGVTVNAAGEIFVADTGSCTIRKIDAAAVVTTVAGSNGDCAVQDGSGSGARFLNPSAITVDASGNLYVADVGADGGSALRHIAPDGTVTTLAGQAGSPGRDNGTGTAARFGEIRGLALLADGSLIVADYGTGTLRKVTTGGVVTTALGGDNQVGERSGSSAPLPGAAKGIAVQGSTLYWTTENAVMKGVPQ